MSSTIENNRISQRRRALIGAKLVFNEGRSVLECTVRDISETGAQLQIENALIAPETFDLHLSDGRDFHCQIRWRKMNRMGVIFL